LATQNCTDKPLAGITSVTAFERKPRPAIKSLVDIVGSLDDNGIARLCGYADGLLSKRPRFPMDISVATDGLSDMAVHLLAMAELIDSVGVRELATRAKSLAPRQKECQAKIISLVNRD